ncbi:MAG: PAS domain-containing protein [Planctomycetes bacterium]|nr:PAS domain-containing protein [Planctomycetota bacterium]
MTLRRFPQPDPRLVEKLKWLLFIRLAVAVVGIGAVLLSRAGVWRFSLLGFDEAYAVLVTACCINLVYLVSLRWVRDGERHVLFQITVDVVLEALLVYFTGGLHSIFTYLIFASVLAAALLVSAAAAMFYASLATVLLCAITLVYFLSGHYQFPLPLLSRVEFGTEITRELATILPYLVFVSLSLHLVAFLAGKLAVELSRIRIVNREILQGMLDGVLVADSGGRLVFFNDQARRLLALPNDRRPDRPVGEILVEEPLQPLRDALQDRLPREFELKISHAGRGEVALDVRTSTLPGERNEPRGMIALVSDVSMRKILDEAVKRSERLQALSELSAGVAHEIRNPLASICGAIQELATLSGLSEDDRRLMEIVRKESSRLDRIITDFLEFARSRSSGFQEIDLAEVLREVSVLLAKRGDGKGVKVEVEAPAHLPFPGDAEQLKQVFYNLGLNALEASKQDGRVCLRGTARALPGAAHLVESAAEAKRASRVGTGVRVDVIDEGQGIEPALMERLFDPFFTTKPKGTGMGLAIAHRIVQAHRGYISVESEPNRRTVFSVWMPT